MTELHSPNFMALASWEGQRKLHRLQLAGTRCCMGSLGRKAVPGAGCQPGANWDARDPCFICLDAENIGGGMFLSHERAIIKMILRKKSDSVRCCHVHRSSVEKKGGGHAAPEHLCNCPWSDNCPCQPTASVPLLWTPSHQEADSLRPTEKNQ